MVFISGILVDSPTPIMRHVAVRHELLENIGVPADSVARKGEALALSEAKYKYVGALRVSPPSHLFQGGSMPAGMAGYEIQIQGVFRTGEAQQHASCASLYFCEGQFGVCSLMEPHAACRNIRDPI